MIGTIPTGKSGHRQPGWEREALVGIYLEVNPTFHGEWKSWGPQMAILMSLITCSVPVLGKHRCVQLSETETSWFITDSSKADSEPCNWLLGFVEQMSGEF